MEKIEYSKMAELEDKYWWHLGRESIVSNQLRSLNIWDQKILNIGSGTGGTVHILERFGRVTNVDTSDEAIAFAKSRGIKNIKKIADGQLPFKPETFDVIAALDVLEHIKDDSLALKNWIKYLKPGGIIILTVPAYQWLWSDHDESLHHFRRYSASELHRKLNQAGYGVIKRTYAITFSFPLIVGYRLLASILPFRKRTTSYVMLPTPINNLFTILLKIEGVMLKQINMPLGTSVLIMARKPH